MRSALLLALIGGLAVQASESGRDRRLWYDEPAESWQRDALPLGNGKLGCMVFGGVPEERIQFNEDSLWVGGETNTGAYQAFGDVFIGLDHDEVADYRRQLDISRALHRVHYTCNGIRYTRDGFSSAPAGVMVFRFTADQPGGHSGVIRLTDTHDAPVVAEGKVLSAVGDTSRHQFYPKPGKTWENPVVLKYASRVLVLHEGGSVEATEGVIRFKDCDSLVLFLAAATDYVRHRDLGWTDGDPAAVVKERVEAAAERPFRDLLAEHVADYQSLYGRMTMDWGTTAPEQLALPTDERMSAYRGNAAGPGEKTVYEAEAVGGTGKPDPDLEELMFQYARYLMISCSRPGSLPSNLQGLWNDRNDPEWRCDYHSDVNLQMNYWFVDLANLSECFEPFADWFHAIREVRREQTREHFKKRGFAMRVENGIFGGGSYRWSIGDASWLANNIWDHYRYTLDEDYLKARAYPALKDLFMFWEDHLVEIPSPDGEGTVLVSPDGWSPEHGPKSEDGVSFEQQLAWDVLSNFAEASEILGIDATERAKAIEMRDRLLGPRIGKWGQLQEWMVDRDDPENRHRHLSHLIAVHPGRQISPLTTPELAEAARVSMNARGDGATGWSKAWKINMWARLHDGDRAYKLLAEMIRGNVYDNLLDAHPPFQIDGNFGYASGICELLVQSHMDGIHLLPALPEKWSEGRVHGIRARGGFSLNVSWRDGEFMHATIFSEKGGDCVLRSNGPVLKGGGQSGFFRSEDGVIRFSTEPGEVYSVWRDPSSGE